MGYQPSQKLLAADEAPAVDIHNDGGRGNFVLICEHASRAVPRAFSNLGMTAQVAESHAAWDPGALSVASHLSALLDAPLVAANWSRLVFDLNRDPVSPEAMRATSERYDIPGNHGLGADEKGARTAEFYQPFHAAVSALLDARSRAGLETALVTIHSFTPVYHGVRREVELGILHDTDAVLADAVLASADRFTKLAVARNEPYGPQDGVTHTLLRHGIARALPNVMIEIRNDLVGAGVQQKKIAGELAAMLEASFAAISATPARAMGKG